MSKDSEATPPGGQFLVYQMQDWGLTIDVRFEGETVLRWGVSVPWTESGLTS